MMQRLIKVDNKVRTDSTYPAGYMDVISIEKTNENFRLIYDVKGRFTIHRITKEEAQVGFFLGGEKNLLTLKLMLVPVSLVQTLQSEEAGCW